MNQATNKKSPDKPPAEPAGKTITYTKEKLLASQRYKPRRDLLNALLTDGESYTREQADKLIDGYLKSETEPVFHKHGQHGHGKGRKN